MDIIRLKKKREKKRPMIDRQTAFVEFKRDHGKDLEGLIIQNRNDLRDKKHLIKSSTDSCNDTKKEMDKFKDLLDQKADEKKQ